MKIVILGVCYSNRSRHEKLEVLTKPINNIVKTKALFDRKNRSVMHELLTRFLRVRSAMPSSFSVFYTGLLILYSVYSVYSLMCWHCDSLHDPKCVDPFDNKSMPMKDCALEKLETYPGLRGTMCRKIRQKVYGKWRFYRSCAFLGEPGIGGDERYCLMRTGTHNIFTEYCTCHTRDGCNGASSFSYSALNFMLAPAVYIVYRNLL